MKNSMGLCRGKREDNGEWVYGYLLPELRINGKVLPSIIPADKNGSAMFDEDGDYIVIDVIPETIGYYTLLPDKNGAKIFDGDILEGDLEDRLDPGAKWRSIVVWGTFGWMCKGRQTLPMDEFDILEGEVIGNIHDNPELL